MSSTWGNHLKLSVFGESHGPAIGVVIDGLPAGEPIDMDAILLQMARRAPGRDRAATTRKECDFPEILSGIFENSTSGAPLCAIMRNNDTHSTDYAEISHIPRPGHADYTGFIRYGGHNDYRGGGHFSGRLTAPMVFAGAVCRQILARRGVEIGAHLLAVGGARDDAFDPETVDADNLRELISRPFPVLGSRNEERMRTEIESARRDGDSVGGIVECAAVGLPAGIGDPVFGGVENRLAGLLFGIPAVKGIEFGDGFAAASLRGSRNNDAFRIQGGEVRTETNHAGGILGGITSGMPLVVRAAFKPTPSIALPQRSVDLHTMRDTGITVHGRHDPCVAIRAVPVVEGLTAVCLLDLLLEANGNDIE